MLFRSLVVTVLVFCAASVGCVGTAMADAPFPFFAYCIDTHDSMHRSLPDQAKMLKELGYDGVGHLWLDNIPERLASLDVEKLRLFQITIQVSIAPDKPAYDPKIREIFPLLKGRNVQICMIVGGMPPSDPAGDARAVAVVRELADMAADSGTELLLYPHVNDWLEKVSDGVRVAKQVDRPNVGVMFNLCHWMKADPETNLKTVLTEALPWLRAASINGTDAPEAVRAGTGNWLQPLDRGSYDVLTVLETLKEVGYSGPVGLQCWGIEGDAREHLARSMGAWKKLVDRLESK